MYEYGEDFIDNETLKKVWHEIDLIYDQMKGSKETGAAIIDGKYIKSGKGFFHNDWMAEIVLPTISSLKNRFYDGYTQFTVLVNYYDDGDYYHEHHDTCKKTLSIFLSRDGSDFKGGDFRFTETDETLPFKNNSYVLFDSRMKHEVTEVRLNNKKDGMGRFSLTYFLN